MSSKLRTPGWGRCCQYSPQLLWNGEEESWLTHWFWRFLLEYSHDISPSPPLAKESCMVMPERKEMEKFNQMSPWKKTWRYLVNGPNDCHKHNAYSHHSMQLASRYQSFLQSLRISDLNPYGSWHSPTWNVSLRRHESSHKHWFKARQTCIWAWVHASWVISEKLLTASCLSFLICKIRRMVLTVWFWETQGFYIVWLVLSQMYIWLICLIFCRVHISVLRSNSSVWVTLQN